MTLAKQVICGVSHLLGARAPLTVHMKELTVTGKSEADKFEGNSGSAKSTVEEA